MITSVSSNYGVREIFFRSIFLFFAIFFFGFHPAVTHASYPELTLRYQHHLFTIDPDAYPTWKTKEEAWTYAGAEILPASEWLVDGDSVPPLPEGVARTVKTAWNTSAIRQTLEEKIALAFDRPAGDVTIRRGSSGAVLFDGVGLTGRKVDSGVLATLVVAALEQGISDIFIPVEETQPRITVDDPSLATQGIREVVTVGESDFAGSPKNRKHNIQVGLSKFNGTLIPKGATFSFNTILGPVNGATGYLKELVIKGDKTEPDYGGGLCQISSTAYRGVWEYGFPIVDRRNHSYAVSYYEPVGTDATVYLPNPDMKFLNDSAGSLLIQTYTENDKAYYIYYGTKDARKAEVYGPFISARQSPPSDRYEQVTSLPPGVKRKVGDRHAGLTAVWYRTVEMPVQAEIIETYRSVYQARPLFYQIGVEALPAMLPAEDIPVTPEPDGTGIN